MRRDTFSVSTFADVEAQDRGYWLQQTPQARLRAMELTRWINYGGVVYGGLQKVFEIVTLKDLKYKG
jgi:hypothetical protein